MPRIMYGHSRRVRGLQHQNLCIVTSRFGPTTTFEHGTVPESQSRARLISQFTKHDHTVTFHAMCKISLNQLDSTNFMMYTEQILQSISFCDTCNGIYKKLQPHHVENRNIETPQHLKKATTTTKNWYGMRFRLHFFCCCF